MLEHADQLKRKLDEHPPDAVVRLSLTDDVFLRSYNRARIHLGIPLPLMKGRGPAAGPRATRMYNPLKRQSNR